MSKVVIINMDLAIDIPEGFNDDEAQLYAADYELPHGYVEDSFEFVRIEENENG